MMRSWIKVALIVIQKNLTQCQRDLDMTTCKGCTSFVLDIRRHSAGYGGTLHADHILIDAARILRVPPARCVCIHYLQAEPDDR